MSSVRDAGGAVGVRGGPGPVRVAPAGPSTTACARFPARRVAPPAVGAYGRVPAGAPPIPFTVVFSGSRAGLTIRAVKWSTASRHASRNTI